MKIRRSVSLLASTGSMLSSVVLLLTNCPAQSQVQQVEPLEPPPSAETGQMVDETPTLWFVELASPPVADGTRLSQVRAEKASFRAAARAAGLAFTERYAFDTLWNGLSVRINRHQLAALARLPGVKAIYPVETIARPPTETPLLPELFTSISMIGADVAQSSLGLTGAGVKVAVMDTGIDVDHPDFGGGGVPGGTTFPSARIAYGYDFVGDAYNADPTSPSYNPVPAPDPNPDDCGGHGTHVAGIIGANGTVKGVAPAVIFGAYRVFGCDGSTESDIMIAAMERALADGMHILNMSIGSAYTWPQYPTAQAADRLVNKGMVVVASIGNNGANGLYSAGAPGLGKNVIGVASYDNTHTVLPYLEVNGQKIGYVTMTFSPQAPTSGTYEVVAVDSLGCDPLAVDLTGKVALISRGTCSFAVKAVNAINAGAVAVLIHNNVPGIFNGTLGAPLPNPKPVVGISQADGLFIRGQTAPVLMTWTDQSASFPSPTAGLISSFSSYGLAPDLTLKPDIGAPGGNIYSTYPLEKGEYAVMGGTSMASPHVAGAAALFLQAKPKTPSQIVRGILQNSADPAAWWGNPGLGFLDNVHRQGAGMVDIDDAILAATRIEPSKLSLGESQAGPVTTELTIFNSSSSAVQYDLSSVNALSTGPNTYSPTFTTSDALVAFSVPSVTVPAKGEATVVATIMPATAPDKGQYGGYLVFTPQGGGQVYRVPFAGFVGDYQSIVALKPTTNGLPWLAKLVGTNYVKQADGTVFTLENGDVPYVLAHFEHATRKVELQIVHAMSGKPVHPVFPNVLAVDYFPRNSTANAFFAFDWNGTRSHDRGKGTFDHRKMVPDGQYKLILKALKALGDPANPAHWETWTSPVLVIDRP